jgi:glycosyltransferase involved in cell wall biosynthesis
MSNRRVVIAINTSWNIVNFRAGLIRALIGAGYEVVAVAPPDDYSAQLAELGCRYVALSMDNQGISPPRDAALLLRFRALLARERPVAFLGYTIKPNVYGSLAARSLGIPTINNISGLGTAFIRNTWLTRVVTQLYRAALRPAGRVFFQNEEDRTVFVAKGLVRPERTEVLPGSGIDLEAFKPLPRSPGLKEGPRFLLIARLLRDKGVVEFVEAARILRRTWPNAVFQLLGFLDVQNRTAITKADVDRWVAEGVVDYLGSTDDVRPHIADADCIVLPSYREGTPRTLLEAAAMGKPLIATDVPGCRNVVTDGENGFLCRARDAVDLAAKISSFLELSDDSRAHMGLASRAKVEREFDEHLVVNRYLIALDELVAGSPRRPGPGWPQMVND